VSVIRKKISELGFHEDDKEVISISSNKKRKMVDLSDTDTDTDTETDIIKTKRSKVDVTPKTNDEKEEIITKVNDKYICNACKKTFNSKYSNVKQHLNTDEHKRNLKSYKNPKEGKLDNFI